MSSINTSTNIKSPAIHFGFDSQLQSEYERNLNSEFNLSEIESCSKQSSHKKCSELEEEKSERRMPFKSSQMNTPTNVKSPDNYIPSHLKIQSESESLSDKISNQFEIESSRKQSSLQKQSEKEEEKSEQSNSNKLNLINTSPNVKKHGIESLYAPYLS